MIQISPQMRIFVCVEPVDFRKGIDGLCRIARDRFKTDPLSGAVFVFVNRQKTALRLLVYDGQGFWLCHKRLSEGRFAGWSKESQLDVHQLHCLLWNVKTEGVGRAKFFKKLTSNT